MPPESGSTRFDPGAEGRCGAVAVGVDGRLVGPTGGANGGVELGKATGSGVLMIVGAIMDPTGGPSIGPTDGGAAPPQFPSGHGVGKSSQVSQCAQPLIAAARATAASLRFNRDMAKSSRSSRQPRPKPSHRDTAVEAGRNRVALCGVVIG